MIFKLSFIALLLTIPLFSAKVYFGLPLWGIMSLFFTAVFALMLILAIEKNWNALKESEDE